MSSLWNPFMRTQRLFSRYFRRQYSGPLPTYPANNPAYINPALLERRSPLQSLLRIFVAGAFLGLPGYWIFWLGQKVSIPYCISNRKAAKVDVDRLDSFQTRVTSEQKVRLLKTMIETAVEKVLLEIKESVGLPFQIDLIPGSLTVKTPKIDPTRIIYRLDISRDGITRSQKTFNPADISPWSLSKDILPDSTSEGEVGYKSLDDVHEGFIYMEAMVKVTGPKELGGRLGTVEFAGVINVETAEVVKMEKTVLRVMGRKVVD